MMSKRKLSVLAYAAALVLSTNSSVVHAITKVSKYAYVAENSQIAVYAVNPDGGLRNIQAVSVPPGVTNSNGVLGVNVVVSPSNKFLYYLNAGQSISGFKIGTNGTLSQIAGSPFPANGATWIAFTPNGKFAYAVAFTYSQYVQEFEVDTSTGALTSIGSVFSGPDACDATVNSKGSFLYVPNCSGNTISAFSINGTSGVLTAVSGSPFTVPGVPVNALLSPKGKYLFSVNFANGHGGESISVFDVNSKTGALTLKSNNLSPSGWLYGGGEAILDPSGSFIYVASAVADVGVKAFSVNEVNGAIAPIGLYPAGSSAFSVTSDVDTGFLYVGNLGGGTATEPPLFAFSITPGTGALTQIATYGIDGQAGYILAFADGTASVAYTPTFAYATNSGSKSITEVSIAEGAFGAVTGSPLTDKNGPKTSVATENHEYFYTGNSNGSISEYKIEATGALAKIKGSPITGLVNSVALGFSPFYNLLYAEDPSADVEDIYSINPTTGVLALSASGSTDGNSPQAIASDPFGQFYLVVNAASAAVGIGIPGTGFVGTVATGANPAAITLDPSSQFVYVANSGDNTVSAYNLTLASPYLTPIGSAVAAGATPSALVAEPYGKYLYVANTGSNTISAYYIDPFAGILTPISGTFTTQSRPSALSVSNDGAYLYVADEGAGLLEQFTINADGTLTNTGSNYGLGTAPSSLTTVGTYK